MNIEQALQKVCGFGVKEFDRKMVEGGRKSTFEPTRSRSEAIALMVINPKNWQAVGKVEGWKNYIDDFAVGERIRKARKEGGLTQKELGKELGYTPMGISHFEKGRRVLKVSTIERLCSFFKKEPMYFVRERAEWKDKMHQFIDTLIELSGNSK